jgi:hypothetical protein
MASPSPEPQKPKPKTFYKFTGKAIKVLPGERIRSKKFGHFDDPVIPRSYWYVTAGLVAVALVLGLLVGRFLLS